MKRAQLQPFYAMLHLFAGRCPHCGGKPGMPDGSTVIYRLTRRSVTFKCKECTLQWTMTMHRISEAARVHAEHLQDQPEDSLLRRLVDDVARSFAIPETRGRRREIA